MRRFIYALLVLSFLSINFYSCAALFNSAGGTVSFNSNPTGAEVIVDGQSLGTTPVTLKLDRKTMHKITIRKEGKEKNYVLNKKIGAGWVILDVLGGFAPIIIDAATGSWNSLSPKTVNAQL